MRNCTEEVIFELIEFSAPPLALELHGLVTNRDRTLIRYLLHQSNF